MLSAETLPTQTRGRSLALNDKGFLADFTHWDDEVAEIIALEEGLLLSDRHWAIIHFLRDYYAEFHTPPTPRLVVKAVGSQIERRGIPCTTETIRGLFPSGGCHQACRIAGLPETFCRTI
ncbi:MAG: TusE/DsrC/DsvC family sulfur relay protein [Pseudomonadota bacterium]